MGEIIMILNDISNAADQGILSGTEDAAQAALEKIHAAIASAFPVDSRAVTCATEDKDDGSERFDQVECAPADESSGSTVYRTPKHRLVPIGYATSSAKKTYKRIARTPISTVMETTLTSGRRLSCEWRSHTTTETASASLFDGDHHVCEITFFDKYQGRTTCLKIMSGAFKGMIRKFGKNIRKRDNRKAKKAAYHKALRVGMLTPTVEGEVK